MNPRIDASVHAAAGHPATSTTTSTKTGRRTTAAVLTTTLGAALVGWTTMGYREPRSRPAQGVATVITPPAAVAVLRSGYPVHIDASAQELAG